MAVKKATVDSTMAKVEAAAKKAPVKEETKATPAKKAPAKKPVAKVAEAKTEEKKTEAPVKAETKAAPAKKAPAKKTATKATETKAATAKKAPAKKAATAEKVVIEYAGGQVVTSDIVAKAAEVSGKKSIKSLNVYYQPETGMVYFTADGEEGSFAL